MTAPQARPANIDQLIATIQREFPAGGIRITGHARTIRRQAEVMAQRIPAPQHLKAIEARINAFGARVIREPNAAGERHWHVDW